MESPGIQLEDFSNWRVRCQCAAGQVTSLLTELRSTRTYLLTYLLTYE